MHWQNTNELSFLLNISLYRNEICDPEKITSFINHHIPDAILKTESKEKLVYTVPVERTDKFPGNLIMITMEWNLGTSIHIIIITFIV